MLARVINRVHSQPLTWGTLVRMEPRLSLIESELLASPPPRGQRFWFQYEVAKKRVSDLLGWFSDNPRHPVLSTSAAFDLAIGRVLTILERPNRRRGGRA